MVEKDDIKCYNRQKVAKVNNNYVFINLFGRYCDGVRVCISGGRTSF